MAVIFTGGRSQDAQEFTSNKRLLLAAVDKFTGQKLRSATLNKNERSAPCSIWSTMGWRSRVSFRPSISSRRMRGSPRSLT